MIEAPLTIAEGEELKELRDRAYVSIMPKSDEARLVELTNRCLLYGSEGVEAQSFEGLEPRYGDGTLTSPPDQADSGVDDGAAPLTVKFRGNEYAARGSSLWLVSYGEELQDQRADRAARPSRIRRLAWAIEWRAQAALDFINEAQYRVRRAWEVLRHG